MTTWGPSVGRRRSSLRECLYAQCSDHMRLNMASSTPFGSRPRRSTISAYSSSVRPSSRCRVLVAMGVTLDEEAAANVRLDRLEDLQPVGGPGERVDGVLGMRHQSEHVAALITHAGDVILRTVRVLAGRVAENDANGIWREVTARGVLDRDREPIAVAARARERRVSVNDLQIDLAE